MLERPSSEPDAEEGTSAPRRRSAAAAMAAQAAAPRRTLNTERAMNGPTTVTRARAPLAAAPPPPPPPPPPAVPPPRAGRRLTSRATASLKVKAPEGDFDIPLAPMRPSRVAGAPVSPPTGPIPGRLRRPGATIPPSSAQSAQAAAAPAARAAAPPPAAEAAPRLTEAFIAQNQMVERYLTGQLSPKWTQEFERFCREHPRFLRDTGVHKRLQAGMDLLVATGEAAAPQGKLSRFHQLHIGWLVTSVVVLGGSLWATITWSSSLAEQVALMRRQANNRTLPLPTSEREIRLVPSRDGVMTTPAIVIANRAAQMLNFQIDETRSPYKIFKVTIDRVDQGRVQVISGLQKDAKGSLLMSLNSGALGPGNYQLAIEGFTPKGDTEPDSWVTIGIAPNK